MGSDISAPPDERHASSPAPANTPSWLASIHPDDRDEVLAAYAELMRGHDVVGVKYRVRKREEWAWLVTERKAMAQRGSVHPLLDLKDLLARVEGDVALLGEVVQMFVADAGAMLDEIARAVAEEDVERLGKATHVLKGAAGNFGAEEVVASTRALEAAARSGIAADTAAAHARLKVQVERLVRVLEPLQKPEELR